MLEYFTYKKAKKHQAEKRAQAQAQSPLLDEEDENFLQRIVSAEGTPPPLPERPNSVEPEARDSTGNNSQMVEHNGAPVAAAETKQDKGKGKEKENEKPKKSNRFSFLSRSGTKKASPSNLFRNALKFTLTLQPRTRNSPLTKQS